MAQGLCFDGVYNESESYSSRIGHVQGQVPKCQSIFIPLYNTTAFETNLSIKSGHYVAGELKCFFVSSETSRIIWNKCYSTISLTL